MRLWVRPPIRFVFLPRIFMDSLLMRRTPQSWRGCTVDPPPLRVILLRGGYNIKENEGSPRDERKCLRARLRYRLPTLPEVREY